MGRVSCSLKKSKTTTFVGFPSPGIPLIFKSPEFQPLLPCRSQVLQSGSSIDPRGRFFVLLICRGSLVVHYPRFTPRFLSVSFHLSNRVRREGSLPARCRSLCLPGTLI